ncbi:hypothetical protein Y032_0039g100 [Ancylostoma ceylanicum]|uniref:Uncharacterized protein n=1 Tax=Ancylostoma ceylanicum TaxID=53326 RepID=A0A016UJF1_9BILA|nr:hypothetical protein Y032_0039g100 [Ancylostoma ceylanicum]
MSLNRNSVQKVQLNNEELQKLLNKLSSDERKELTDTLKQCTTENDPYSLGTETMQPMNTGMPSDNYERTFDLTTENSDQRKPPQNYMYGMDAPSYMSGTPTTPRSSEFSR